MWVIRGQGGQRRYFAWRPTGGRVPDFHTLDAFGPLDPELSSTRPRPSLLE
jgi:hypothetical protein